jgi:uncharacterized protein DUF6538
MRALMGLIKDRHGTYYARHKVPERLQAVVARILDNGKARQVWLKKSLGTKVVAQANVRAKPVQIEFDRLLAKAEAQLKERPLRSGLADVEIKRIADFFLASALAVDEQRRITGKGDDPLFISVDARCAMEALALEPGRGLSPGTMEAIQNDTAFVLATTEDQLARGDIRLIQGEVDELLNVFQINLDPNCADYFKLARAVQVAAVKYLRAVLARQKGEPIETPAVIAPNQEGTPGSGTLKDALAGWQKERSPSPGVLAEYERAARLFSELTVNFQLLRSSVHTRGHSVRPYRTCLGTVPGHCYTCRCPSWPNGAVSTLKSRRLPHRLSTSCLAASKRLLYGHVTRAWCPKTCLGLIRSQGCD